MLKSWPAPLAGMAETGHPLWSCGMRPFFLLCAISAALLPGCWIAALALGLSVPEVPGGPLVWHAHELLLGFCLAAVAGFALTAIPEFTGTSGVSPRAVRMLVALWLAGRLGFWLSGTLGHAALLVAAVAQLGLLTALAALFGPRLWTTAGRRHLAFLWALLGWVLLAGGFYIDAWRGIDPARWLFAMLGLLMMLIVVAMSRISMRIVNQALELTRQEDSKQSSADPAIHTSVAAPYTYIARPPRRNLALFCIGLATAVEFFAPGSRPAAWLALAAAAALFNLLGDWHVGRALFRRSPLMLYGVYLFMALGYGVMGIAVLAGRGNPAGVYGMVSGGRHLLTIGAAGLNIYAVMCIAGRAHCGLPPDRRAWVPAGALLIAAAAVMRLTASWSSTASSGSGMVWLIAAVVCWTAALLLLLSRLAPVLCAARTDGRNGCEGPAQRAA